MSAITNQLISSKMMMNNFAWWDELNNMDISI